MKIVRFRDSAGYEREGKWTDSGIETANRIYEASRVDILPPCKPSKILCLYGNYVEHLRESGHSIPEDIPKRPKLFLKGPNTIVGHQDIVKLPYTDLPSDEVGELGDIETGIGRVDYEAELGVVIGKQAKGLDAEEAMDYVKGFTCFNDVSNRDYQSTERNWVRGKSFDNASPIGPVIATPDEVPEQPTVKTLVNGEVEQSSEGDEFVFSVSEVIEEITKFMTLEPGDVISMGTPAGVGPIEDSDKVEIEVEGVGTLTNHFES